MPSPTKPRSWDCWAHDQAEGFAHFGPRDWVALHGSPEPIVPVRLVEDPQGAYWGWLDKDATFPSLVWGTEVQYRICFPCRPEDLEARGQGRTLRFSVVRRQK